MKYLAIVERTAEGFRGFAPRLPGCEVIAATEKEAEVGIVAAVKLRLRTEKTNDVEVIVATEAPPQRPRSDGLDASYDEARKFSRPEDLEFFLHLDEQNWVSAEQLRRDLEDIARGASASMKFSATLF
jgi:hypothetical protein